jgi:hypothetical protein
MGSPQPVTSGTLGQLIVISSQPNAVPVGLTGSVTARGGDSGNPVTFSTLTPTTCSVSNLSPGPPQGGVVTYAGMVTGIAQGMCVLAANQAGSVNYDAAQQLTFDFRVGDPVAQTISYGVTPTSVPVGGVGYVNATATSGLPISLASNTPTLCTVSDGIVTGLALGNCTIAASQAGNELYAPAPQTTVTFPVVANSGPSVLRVSRSGSGVGVVESSPAGVHCGITSCAWNFANGSTVSLLPIIGTDSAFDRWEGACTGTGACNVTMNGNREVTAYFNSTIPRLSNISTRARVESGENVLIGGFIIGGTAPKSVVVRVRGPSLAGQVAGALMDPGMHIMAGSTLIHSLDNWGTAGNAAQMAASGFAPSDAREPALLMTLNPGAYTAIVEGTGGATGVGIVEIFEVDNVNVPLLNISSRGRVQSGENVMIAGFIIQGSSAQTVAVRVRGPTLATQGISGPLMNPQLTLLAGPTQVAANDDGQQAGNATQIQASGFAPVDDREPAILMTLDPGAYTAIVSGVGNTSGIAVVEVFRVP